MSTEGISIPSDMIGCSMYPNCTCLHYCNISHLSHTASLVLEQEAPTPFKPIRAFETGATRSSDAMRPDPEGFLSPLSIERYCDYMNKHRKQADGSIRDSDNWQKGMPVASYMKGMYRHMLHLWARHRGYEPTDSMAAANKEEDLCAIIFNAQGYLHTLVKERREAEEGIASIMEKSDGR